MHRGVGIDEHIIYTGMAWHEMGKQQEDYEGRYSKRSRSEYYSREAQGG